MLYNGVVSINIIISENGDLLELPRIKLLAVLYKLENTELQRFSEFIEEQLKIHIHLKNQKKIRLKTLLEKK